MAHVLIPTNDFLYDLNRLDKSIRLLIEKKLNRIKEMPDLSKPLKHGSNIYSERVKGYRVIFKVQGNHVILLAIQKRDDAYGA